MHPDRGYINIRESIPIVIAAQGPKALEVAGEIGDGWMAPVCDVQVFKQNFDAVKSAAKRAGRDVHNFGAMMFAAACLLQPGESLTSARVLSQMGPLAAVALHALWETSAVAAQLPSSLQSIYEKYRDEYVDKLDMPADRRYLKVHEGHTIYVKPGEERFLTAELIAAFSMTAPRERIIERIRELEAAGLDEIAFCIPNDGARERIEELGREIVSRY
jgi:5,10-methylenetetrahydromethanopterin reductase